MSAEAEFIEGSIEGIGNEVLVTCGVTILCVAILIVVVVRSDGSRRRQDVHPQQVIAITLCYRLSCVSIARRGIKNAE